MEKEKILGFDVCTYTQEHLLNNIFKDYEKSEQLFIVNINPEIAISNYNNEELKQIFNKQKYQIPDGVFGISNNNTYELSSGYFVEEKTFDTIDQLIKEMNQSHQAVRITEGKFILGNVYSRLSEISEDKKVFSIEFLDDVR